MKKLEESTLENYLLKIQSHRDHDLIGKMCSFQGNRTPTPVMSWSYFIIATPRGTVQVTDGGWLVEAERRDAPETTGCPGGRPHTEEDLLRAGNKKTEEDVGFNTLTGGRESRRRDRQDAVPREIRNRMEPTELGAVAPLALEQKQRGCSECPAEPAVSFGKWERCARGLGSQPQVGVSGTRRERGVPYAVRMGGGYWPCPAGCVHLVPSELTRSLPTSAATSIV